MWESELEKKERGRGRERETNEWWTNKGREWETARQTAKERDRRRWKEIFPILIHLLYFFFEFLWLSFFSFFRNLLFRPTLSDSICYHLSHAFLISFLLHFYLYFYFYCLSLFLSLSSGCIMGEISDGQPLFPGESEVDQLYIGELSRIMRRERGRDLTR